MPEAITRTKVVVVGLGMVSSSFIEKLLERDELQQQYALLVFGEEKHLAYNRVGLTEYFSHRNVNQLLLNPSEWYKDRDESIFKHSVSEPVTKIDRWQKKVVTPRGAYPYDILVLATGSNAVLPHNLVGDDVKGRGIFGYRTIQDLEDMIEFANSIKHPNRKATIVGGGLLGLEAAKAIQDMQCFGEISLVHRSKWLLSQQLDQNGGALLVEEVKKAGINVLLQTEIESIEKDNDGHIQAVIHKDGSRHECHMLCFAIGIKPRDELGAAANLKCHPRGGFIVDDALQTNDPSIYAVGECANWHGNIFGLIAPGVEMADVVTWNLTQAKLHQPREFHEPNLGTRLKLMGVNVASFGDFFADRDGPKKIPGHSKKLSKHDVQVLHYHDPFEGVYKKLILSKDGKYLLGGILVGNVGDYTKLNHIVNKGQKLDVAPSVLVLGKPGQEEDDGADLDDSAQICSCHNVTKGDLSSKVRDGTCSSVGELKSCTKAGTACGGCETTVKAIFAAEMKAMGKKVSNALCTHFTQSRADLFNIIMVKNMTTFESVMKVAGKDPEAGGCEICKPVIGSIMATLYNKHVMDKPLHGLQDTNDRFLGNIQRDGTFSVIPRVSAGEITPEKLIVLGEVARKYTLYSKITGGQRVDLFGAQKADLPAIWRDLNAGGFESGHGYGKSLRTVKSCVGSTWCRFGQGDSVGMAVKLEERYKSIRSPHKIKGGVSGCVRDCAEFHNKDFGLCATDKGYNLYVGGNGGITPAHAQLLASNVQPDKVIPILDRYLMFYMRTGDRLQRTARWLANLPGGIKYLQDVIIHDTLGIAQELQKQMEDLVSTFFDEWKVAAEDPHKAKEFRQFVNTEKRVAGVQIVKEREQQRPALWPKESAHDDFKGQKWTDLEWEAVCSADELADVDAGTSCTILRGDTQIALFKLKGKLYASQNMCGHRRAFVLSQGILSTDENSQAYVSCPLHKRNYILDHDAKNAGSCKNDETFSIATFEIKEEDGKIWLKLPPSSELDSVLGMTKWRVMGRETEPAAKILIESTPPTPPVAPLVTCGNPDMSW